MISCRPAILVMIPLMCLTPFRAPGRAEEAGDIHVIRLLNGDFMQGRVLNAGGTELEFHPRWTRNPVNLGLRFINYVLVDKTGAGLPEPQAWLQLTNDDRLDGRFLGMDGEWIHWETMWGQKINARRRMVKSMGLYPSPENILLPKAHSLEAWGIQDHGRGQSGGDLMMIGGELIFPATNTVTVTRELPPIPERFVFEFKTRNPEGHFSKSFSLLGSVVGRSPGSFVVQVNQRHLFAQQLTVEPNTQNNWREDLPHHAQTEQFFQVFMDLKSEKALVYLNGRLLKEWGISNGSDLAGSENLFFSFRPTQGNVGMRLSHVRMLAWDGTTTPQDPAALERQKDVIILRDGHTLEGRVLSGDAESLTMEPEAGGRRTVPVEQISIYYPPVPLRATPRRRNRDIEVNLHGNENRLIYTLTGFDGEHWTGEGGAWSEPMNVPESRLAFVRFNIYRRSAREAAEISIDLERSFLDGANKP